MNNEREPPSQCLPLQAFSHGHVRRVNHDELGTMVNGQTVVRYLRFLGDMRVDYLELSPVSGGRWVPNVPTHPAHVTVSVLSPRTGRWRLLKEVELPRLPALAGEGLRQGMTIEEMERVISKGSGTVHRIELGGIHTDLLRVECDREHPVWPSHGESNGNPYHVPFSALDSLRAFGVSSGAIPVQPAYQPVLEVVGVKPKVPQGMSVTVEPGRVLFSSPRFSMGFSLRRPILLHMGWDVEGGPRAGQNRINRRGAMPNGGTQSGPLLRTFHADHGPHTWTGTVEVTGNRVAYRQLDCGQGVLIDAIFTVRSDGFALELTQRCDRALPVLEAEAWRLIWDVAAAMTGAAAVPSLKAGRNGDVELPMAWAGDGVGCLTCERVSGDPTQTHLQIESYRWSHQVTGGIVMGTRPSPMECQYVPAGIVRSKWRWTVDNLQPATKKGVRASEAIRRHWGSVCSCFRPEYGGFSNNAVSTNCHVNQHGPAELVAFTRRPKKGPDPVAMHRFTVGRALLGGGGYGFWRNLYLDSDPVLLSAAGRLHQAAPDKAWLRSLAPGVTAAVRRVLGTIGREGLAICRALSGNSGTYRWSSNAMDVVGFGHMDAYVNAWTYRGLRNATALLLEMGEKPLAGECCEAADRLRAAFPEYLLNPETGWVAGWRSRDGELHDAAYLWVNGVVCAFGLLETSPARRALAGLEALRCSVGAGAAHFGVPFNLRPIPQDDHMLPKMQNFLAPTFENYTDGAMASCGTTYYLRALDIHGMKAEAGRIASDMEEGYVRGHFNGGVGSGVEFYRWDGIPCGYEGTFVLNYGPLYAMAVRQGVIKPFDPEWWPTANRGHA